MPTTYISAPIAGPEEFAAPLVISTSACNGNHTEKCECNALALRTY